MDKLLKILEGLADLDNQPDNTIHIKTAYEDVAALIDLEADNRTVKVLEDVLVVNYGCEGARRNRAFTEWVENEVKRRKGESHD